jgi:RNA polymerase sigma factor for flagellar operon FliA
VLERFTAALDLVEIIARQVGRAIGQPASFEDLVSYGREGLLDAARRFDPARGVPFRTYANYRVRGAVIDGVRALSRLPRRAHERLSAFEAAGRVSEGQAEDLQVRAPPGASRAQAERALSDHLAGMATAMAVGLIAGGARGDDGELTCVAPADDPEMALARAELLALVRRGIDDLGRQEAELLRRHYLAGERFDRVAEELGLSKSWASRLHTRAIRRLAERLRGACVPPE